MLWDRVDRSGGPAACWPWLRGRVIAGYGAFVIEGRQKQAHRAAYEAVYGAIPPGLVVRHRCDNPSCCNPRHLELGTQLDNVRDRAERGRTARQNGEANGQAKLTREVVEWLRAEYGRGGVTITKLAEQVGVSRKAVSMIVNGLRWRE